MLRIQKKALIFFNAFFCNLTTVPHTIFARDDKTVFSYIEEKNLDF